MSKGAKPSAYIVTGTTRGIGKALAEKIVDRGHLLFTISRAAESEEGRRCNYYCDLRNPRQVQDVMTRLLDGIPYATCGDGILINNAGVLAPIGSLEGVALQGMDASMHVNLMAPTLLTALFIRASERFGGRRRIIHISSGAALHPYAGWALYCAAKAALNMLTRCVALEQRNRPRGVGICAVAPGVVATNMQAEILRTRTADFPSRETFVRLAKAGEMWPPEKVARLILDLDEDGQFQSGGIYDLRDVTWSQDRPTIQPRPESH
jgi:benzil reductase ((S)-benzoin forming)